MIDVIGIDAPCVDCLVNVDRMPQNNDSLPMNQMSWQGGGKSATAMIALARLGISCGIVANVGEDLYGDMIEWDFQQHGVDTSHLFHVPGTETPLSLVLSDRETMGRSVIWQSGRVPIISQLDAEYLQQAKYLLVPGAHGVFEQAMDIIHQAGGRVVIDADRFDQRILDRLNKIDVFIGSEFFFQQAAKGQKIQDYCRLLQRQGPQTVLFTLGEKGCAGLGSEGAYFEMPAFKVNAIDTTGAGDVFHGAYIYGLLHGWNDAKCALWASAVSAIQVTQLGGRAGIPDAKMVEKFLSKGTFDSSLLEHRSVWYANALENTVKERKISN